MRRVFVHIGLPKTGTSYLQTIVWAHRDELREAGLLVPGRERRDHLWASLEVRDDPSLRRRGRRAGQAWTVVQDAVRDWHGDALISHEFFSAATHVQARAMIEALESGGAEVHVITTTREPLGLFTSSWQEHLKNKGSTRIGRYARDVSPDPTAIWNWRSLDLRLVLDRWGPLVAPERVHVITPPGADQPRQELWSRFCTVLGVPDDVAGPAGFTNSSMGVAEAETLRRLNKRLSGFDRAFDRGVWIRSFLADDRLVPRGGEPFWPGAEQIAECRKRGDDAVDFVRAAGFEVIGDLESIRVPTELPDRRHPDSVTDAEVADVALDLVADLLGEVRRLSQAQRTSDGDSRSVAHRAQERAHQLQDRLRRR
ncbi:MAG: hypothetical protein WB767_16700 [Nocardioides sp.]